MQKQSEKIQDSKNKLQKQQKQESAVNKNNKKVKKQLKIHYQPGQIPEGAELGYFVGELISEPILAAIVTPIIVVTSPYWISLLIAGTINKMHLNKQIDKIQGQLQNTRQLKVGKQKSSTIMEQIMQSGKKSYPIIISEHNSQKYDMLIYSPKPKQGYIPQTWRTIKRQFLERIKINNPETQLFFFAGNQVLHHGNSVKEVYQKFKNQDGILYVKYQVLQTF